MKTNMGMADKIVRVLLALGIAILTYFQVISGTISYVLLAMAFVFVLTSLVGFCPLYGILGLNTCKAKNGLKEKG